MTLSWLEKAGKQGSFTEKTSPYQWSARISELITMTLNSSSPSNQSTDHGDKTAETQEDLLVCPPFPNVCFETLDSSLPYFSNAAFNVLLALATTFANLVVLLAMRRVTSIRLPSKMLLCSLVMTDLGAGSVVQPQFAALLFLRAAYPDLVPCSLFRSYAVTATTMSVASLWTLGAIILDRYAALFFFLKYQQTVTTRRVCAVLAFIWTLAMLFAALTHIKSTEQWRVAVVPVVAGPLLLIVVASIKIYRRLRDQQISQPQAPDQAQQQAGHTLNMATYRRTASAMMWICVLLLICGLPYLCMAAFRVVAAERTALSECLYDFSYSLVLLNSFLNPFVYCFRLPEIHREAVKQLRKLFCRPRAGQRTGLELSILWHNSKYYSVIERIPRSTSAKPV